MALSSRQKARARRNQELRGQANRIYELEAEVRRLEDVVAERTVRATNAEAELTALQTPPLEPMRRVVRRMLLCHAAEMGISEAVLKIDEYLDGLDGVASRKAGVRVIAMAEEAAHGG